MKYINKRILEVPLTSVYNLETESPLHNYLIKAGDSNICVKNCEILMVPTVYKKDFELNLEQSLQDIAGVATAENKLMFRDTSKLENEFLTPELNLKCELGKDNILINSLPSDMFEFVNGEERLVRYPKAPRYVHVDLAEAGGHSEAGISMCHKERFIHPASGEAITIYVFD